jgi:hypothetical protein
MLPQIVVDAERLHQEKKYKDAALLYDRVLAQNEHHPYIVNGLGQCLMHDSNSLGAALGLFHRAVDLFKKDGKVPFEVYMNLGLTYKWSGQHDKAIKYMQKAVDTEENASTLCNYGQLFVETDEDQRGRKALEKAVKLDPGLALAHWNLSLCLLANAKRDDNWERAWAEYEYGKAEGGNRTAKRAVNVPEWDGESGQKILVYGEQGIGDEIMFASMLPDLMQRKEVILDCHPRLTTLFERAFGVRCYGTRKDPEVDWIEAEKPDAIIAIGSLGKFFRKSNASFHGKPYLKADPLPRGEKFRVGISWTGGRIAGRVARRTVPLNWWRTILDVPGVEFVSLQYTDGAGPEVESVRSLGYQISEPPEAKSTDYYETARLVASCDLVITVCTSVVHLAGALGVPTWVMVPKQPAWRYQASGNQPWYRSVRLYRQPAEGSDGWMPVVQRIGLDLEDLMKQQKAA